MISRPMSLAVAIVLAQAASALAEPVGAVAQEVRQIAPTQGGLVVCLDCGDGAMLAQFARTGRFLVHGISSDARLAATARQRLADDGLCGFASVECLPLDPLPYADNLANLLIAEDLPALLKKGHTFAEILRVLAPECDAVLGIVPEAKPTIEAQLEQAGIRGSRFEQKSRTWLVIRKPRPAGMDDWTHWNHAPDGNLVSQDRLIDRPNQIQWITGQHFGAPRSGVPGAGSPSGVRLAAGTALYVMGRQLVARDAFNGVMLWAQDFKTLDGHSVILSGQEVYLLREGQPVALEARTGKPLRTYGDATDRKGLILADGLLLAFGPRDLIACDASTGSVKWNSPDAASAGTPVIAQGLMYFIGRTGLACLTLADGRIAWTKPARPEILFAFGDKVLTRLREKVSAKEIKGIYTALSGKDGAEAWTYTSALAAETYFASGLIWIQNPHDRASVSTEGFHNPKGGISLRWDGLDPASGQVKRSFVAPVTLEYRCHTLYMTDRFLIGNRPVYFTDWMEERVRRFEATRIACGGVCGLGQGLFYGLYTNSTQCMCMRPAMSGVSAYTCDGKTIDGTVAIEEQGRVEQGPAKAPESPAAPDPQDWPMYRYNSGRTSGGPAGVPAQVALRWEQKLLPARHDPDEELLRNDWALNKVSGDAMGQPVIGGGKVFVCLTHTRQVAALDERNGQIAWRFLAPARVDGSPTLARNLCLVGCNDGWLYALRADTGQQVWRFRAAPAERRIVAYGQVESRWPVMGGPAVLDDKAFVLAGRTTESDGGLYVHALDVASGQPLWTARRVKPDDGPIGAWNLRGVQDDYVGPADMLDCDGKTLAISGHRTGRFNVATGQSVSAGSYNAHKVGLMASRYAADNQHVDYPPVVYSEAGSIVVRTATDAQKKPRASIVQARSNGWKTELPAGARVESLAASGETILAAVSLDGSLAGELWVISGKDGAKLCTPGLPAAPVFEGLAVAHGRAFISLQNGALVCLAGP